MTGWEPLSPTGIVYNWSSADANADPDSGSLRVVNLSAGPSVYVSVEQCIPVNSGQSYTLTGKVRVPSGPGQDIENLAMLLLNWYENPDCTGLLDAEFAEPSPSTFDTWNSRSLTTAAVSDARSVSIQTFTAKAQAGGSFIAHFDDIGLRSRSIFQNGFD